MAENSSSTQSSASTEEVSSNPSFDNEGDHHPDEEIIRKKLSLRSYHLPGNSWCQDWAMYMKNNHLVLGLCCYHRYHPVRLKHRLAILLGSLAFGLSMTNAVYLWFLWEGKEYSDVAFSISLGGNFLEKVPDNFKSLDVTNGMAFLWTVGSAVHSIFDLFLWHVIACGCCKWKRFQSIGWSIAISIVSFLFATTSFLFLVRVYEVGDKDDGAYDNTSNDREIGSRSTLDFEGDDPDFQFMYGYLIELVASLFFYSPLVQSLLFTGIFGCGMVPFLGGRPFELRREENREKENLSAVTKIVEV